MQETDGLDMPQLFRQAKNVLEDLAGIPDEENAIATDSQLLSDLDQLSHVAETELQGKYATVPSCHTTANSSLQISRGTSTAPKR